MLNSFWNWFVILVVIVSILACWWLLHWTKGISDREGEEDVHDTGHVWDNDIRELNNPLPRWWLHMFNLTIVFGLLYLVLFPGLGNISGALGWTQIGKYENEMAEAKAEQDQIFARFAEMSPEELMASTDALDTGRRLYAQHCSMCHGSDARGGRGFPNLADGHWQWGEGYDQVLYAINNGRQAAMPALGAAWPADQTNAVVQYVRSLSGLEHDAAAATVGQQTYSVQCIACHGVEGKGNPLLGAPNLTDDYWLYGNDVATLTETLIKGRNGKMPSHADLMSEQQKRQLAAYVTSLSQDG